MKLVRVELFAVLASLLLASAADEASAACNLIPGTTRTFAGNVGSLNRPFSAPGEPVELAVRTCDTSSPGLGATGPEHVVSVVFKRADGVGSGKLVAISTNCAGVNTGACPGSVCKQVTAGELEIVVREGRPLLRFFF